MNACLGMFGNLLQVHVSFSVPCLHLDTLDALLKSLSIGQGGTALCACGVHGISNARQRRQRISRNCVERRASLDRLIQETETWEEKTGPTPGVKASTITHRILTATEKKSIKPAEAALESFNDLSMQGILITDAELNIRGWNHWLELHSGRRSSEMVGKNLLEVWPDLITRRLDEYYRDALGGQVRIVSQRLHGYLLPMPPAIEGTNFDQMQQRARIAFLAPEGQVIGTITVIEDQPGRGRKDHVGT